MPTSTLLRHLRLAAQLLSANAASPSRAARGLLSPRNHPLPSITCLTVSDAVPPSRLLTEALSVDTLTTIRPLARQRIGGGSSSNSNAMKSSSSSSSLSRGDTAALAAVGHDALLLIRSPLARATVRRLAQMLRCSRRQKHSRLVITRLNAGATGMTLAALVKTEDRAWWSWCPPSLLRLLSSSDGPHRFGIGCIPAVFHPLLAFLLALLSLMALSITLAAMPHLLPWCVVSVTLAFATRPDIDSFVAWAKRSAPFIAKRKTLLLDKVRASVAPYVMTWARRPVLSDYGLFSVVTLTDHADYVYVYAGVFSRWCLLGWYNERDNYNFDRLIPRARPPSLQSVTAS